MNDKLEEIKGRMARAVNDDDPQYEESDWKWLVETVDKLESENAGYQKKLKQAIAFMKEYESRWKKLKNFNDYLLSDSVPFSQAIKIKLQYGTRKGMVWLVNEIRVKLLETMQELESNEEKV